MNTEDKPKPIEFIWSSFTYKKPRSIVE
jgi:hypothetical protein